jgi:hypothetical protein
VNTISITPPLTFQEMKSFGDFRTVYCVPNEGGGAGALGPSNGMNYRPSWIQQHLQDVIDHFPTHEFTGYIEYRNTSEGQPPVARYYVRGRRVEMVTPTLVWPRTVPKPVSDLARRQIAAELEAHAESIGWYEGGGVWAEALDVIRQEPWTHHETEGDDA